ALRRRLVRPPADDAGAVPEPAAAYVVVAHLDDQRRPQRLPVGAARRAPAARAAGRVAGEAGRLDQRLQAARQRGPLAGRDGRGEADVVEAAAVVVETEQQRADLAAVAGVTEAADDAVRRAQPLHLQHGALAGLVAA